MAMWIGEVVDRTGVSAATIRYYERRKLLPEPPRTKAGYRQYGPATVNRLRFIKSAQRLGFSLGEIRELLSLRVDPGSPCEPVRRQAEEKAAEFNARIRQLEAMKRTLDRLVTLCSSGRATGECPILEVLEDEAET